MFEAKLESKTWRKIIGAISAIVEEAPLEVTKEGIKFTAMDPSHISMIDFKMPKDKFQEYKIDEEMILGIDVDEMRKIVGRSKPSEILTIKTHENKLQLIFQQLDGEAVRTFSLPLLETVGKEKFKVPQLNTTAKIKLSAVTFDDGIKDAYIIADSISFIAQNDKFIMKAQGDTGEIETEVREWLEYEVMEEARASFNLSYLTDIAKSIENDVVIHLGNDMPIKLEFVLDGAEIVFILAPKVETE